MIDLKLRQCTHHRKPTTTTEPGLASLWPGDSQLAKSNFCNHLPDFLRMGKGRDERRAGDTREQRFEKGTSEKHGCRGIVLFQRNEELLIEAKRVFEWIKSS